MPRGERQIEMTWRCSSCEHQNLGRHKACQQCGDPKDRSETYEMPVTPAAAQTVTETELLRMAHAGANWRCAYCGSDQRKLDNTCGQCGASATEGNSVRAAVAPPIALTPRQRALRWMRKHRVALIVVASVIALGIGIYAWTHRTRTFTAKVADVEWKHTIAIERYQAWTRDGWRDSQPARAFEVVSRGQQIHHYDKVQDGYETQHYTERVACGEDCYDEPERCSETCSDNDNGFATCRTSCSGGGRRCTTKYCNESRTRQVPRYRDEPRYAEGITYKIWDWGPHRSVNAAGHGIANLRWPTDEARFGVGLADQEQERETRTSRYVVTLTFEDGKLAFEVPAPELSRYADGTSHSLVMKRGEPTLVDGKPVQVVSGP